METLIIKNIIGGPSFKVAIVGDDIISEIRKLPTMSFDGTTYYYSAHKITAGHRRTKWYKTAKAENHVMRGYQSWTDTDADEWLVDIF